MGLLVTQRWESRGASYCKTATAAGADELLLALLPTWSEVQRLAHPSTTLLRHTQIMVSLTGNNSEDLPCQNMALSRFGNRFVRINENTLAVDSITLVAQNPVKVFEEGRMIFFD